MRNTKLARAGRLFLSAIYALAVMWLPFSAHVSAATLPADYSLTPVASNLDYPTNTAWLPDGTMLIAEKSGKVRALKDGVMQAQPLADISGTTNDYWDKGLLGLAVDPDYNNNHYLYLMRTFENGVGGYEGSKVNQLVRVTINPATNQMVAGSLLVLVGKDTAASCDDLAVTADCMPSDSPSHSVGDVLFAPDGTLFITTGDGASFTEVDTKALRSQNIDSLGGKLLHIDRNGKGLTTNPFYNGDVNANRSKVWAYGLRNPWRPTIKPGTSTVYIAEVGWDNWEEINVATPGANFGWPCYEGNAKQGLGYASLSTCQQLYTKVNNGQASVKGPLTTWDHSGGSAAALGGAFVSGSVYPASLQGTYLYGDYAYGFLKTLRTNGSDAITAGPTNFATGMPAQVNIEQGPDGYVYIVSISDDTGTPGTGKILRLDYQNTPPPPPVGDCNANEYRAEYFNSQTIGGTAALTRCEAAPLDHDWGEGAPGAGVNTDNFSARYSGNFTFNAGTYKFDAAADDGIRVFLDGQLVVNGWFDQPFTHYQGSVNVTAGTHAVVVEYYDALEDAAAKVTWTPDGIVTPPPTDCSAGQFQADYYNALTPTGTAALTRCENAPINNNWGEAAPAAGVNTDDFSARYTGNFDFQQGQYKFEATADDGVRIFVDGNLVLNGWFDQPATHYENTVALTAGTHAVVVEYYDALEEAILQANWTAVGGNSAPVATITTPAALSAANVGSTVNFSGTATDAQDGTLTGNSLTWSVVIQHCNLGQCHSHFLQQFSGNSGSFIYPDHGTEDYYVELKLVATDSQGATSTVQTVRIDPNRAPVACPSDWFVAEYFNNKTLTGTPVATACTQTVNYDWLEGSPVAGVNTDDFSARFSTTQNFAAGSHKFTITGDDGIRLYIDNALFLNGWKDQPATTYKKNKTMTAGTHTLRLEFYDATERALAKLSWVKL